MSRSPATRVRIASVDIDSVVNRTGLDADGAIQVPVHGPRYDQAAWFTGSPAPGQVGPSVILGHVDSVKTGPSVFFELGGVKKGAKVEVTRKDGKTVAFEVYRVDRYPKDAFPTGAVYGNTRGPELRLITCGGTIDDTTGHYVDNVVVYARSTNA
ncbi:class F sortase [Phycicoccus sp. MAQZ13P-2]|nr:class F sortase [Phycicoccus mangrovi]MBT9273207.1 class F sortase [Phycicoccus mangrovi]